ncbi:hypothetical protein ACICHK_40680 [Streptomyces sp. AHU1]|uniref:hypothetical protein n=1 Tax=Streptomyces sp. AHU1 TaxID=3377215 RepID=UPI003877A693
MILAAGQVVTTGSQRGIPALKGGEDVKGALSDLAGPLPAAFVVAGVTVLATVATAATGQAWRRRLRNA